MVTVTQGTNPEAYKDTEKLTLDALTNYPEATSIFNDEEIKELATVFDHLRISIFNKEAPKIEKSNVKILQSMDFEMYHDKILDIVFRVLNMEHNPYAERVVTFLKDNSDIFFEISENINEQVGRNSQPKMDESDDLNKVA